MPPSREVIVDVGDVAVLFRTTDDSVVEMLERRFARFLSPAKRHAFAFDLTVTPSPSTDPDADLRVVGNHGRWSMRRGDFVADWDLLERRGSIALSPQPYAIDSVLRIVHTLVLSREGGFLLHASSAVKNGRAFIFTGPSGAGKSTIVGLAPADVTVLTDEISYVRLTPDGYYAFGTPFAGELGDVGLPARAPIAALFSLGRGADNVWVPLARPRSVQILMRNILFFADDRDLVDCVLDAACRFAAHVPAYQLLFAPDARVWSAIQ